MMYVKYRIEFCCFCGGYDIFNMLMNVIVFDFKIKWWWGVWFIDFFQMRFGYYSFDVLVSKVFFFVFFGFDQGFSRCLLELEWFVSDVIFDCF